MQFRYEGMEKGELGFQYRKRYKGACNLQTNNWNGLLLAIVSIP